MDDPTRPVVRFDIVKYLEALTPVGNRGKKQMVSLGHDQVWATLAGNRGKMEMVSLGRDQIQAAVVFLASLLLLAS